MIRANSHYDTKTTQFPPLIRRLTLLYNAWLYKEVGFQ